MPKLNKKGFTLIEIIVVLIIIAILAAIAVPAMMKYINDAKEKQGLSETRAIYLAAQTVAVKAYAVDATAGEIMTSTMFNDTEVKGMKALTEFKSYLDSGLAAKATNTTTTQITLTNLKDGVTSVVYKAYGHTYTFANGVITIT